MISLGIRIYGNTKDAVLDDPLYDELPDALKEPQDAVVEALETEAQWAPEQHGNVIVAEPTLMTKYRRTKQ